MADKQRDHRPSPGRQMLSDDCSEYEYGDLQVAQGLGEIDFDERFVVDEALEMIQGAVERGLPHSVAAAYIYERKGRVSTRSVDLGELSGYYGADDLLVQLTVRIPISEAGDFPEAVFERAKHHEAIREAEARVAELAELEQEVAEMEMRKVEIESRREALVKQRQELQP